MAGLALKCAMRTSQSETGQIVVESRRQPSGSCMTVCAIMREVTADMVGIGNLGECGRMTAIAV